jgi:hypothetical protein
VNNGLQGAYSLWIEGNQSSSTILKWYQQSAQATPRAGCLAVSIWWYKIAMLIWSLWLARALFVWMVWAFKQFTSSPIFMREKPPENTGT